MKFASIDDLRESVIHCRQFGCPFRSTARGYYPKPPKGPTAADVMIIFENPKTPGGHSPDEMAFDIGDIKLADAIRLCLQGQKHWLFDVQGADEDMWTEFGFTLGKTVYTTDSHKCPDPKVKEIVTTALKKVKKERARGLCREEYLREEIRLVQPKAIIAFGEPSRKSLAEIERLVWNGNITAFTQDQRVKVENGRCYALLPHPGWYIRQYGKEKGKQPFNDDVRFVFAKVREFLKAVHPELPKA